MKYNGADLSDSFITHKNQFCDMDKAKRLGLKSYKTELDEKVKVLEELLKNFDDGRHKSSYCTAVNLLDLQDIKTVLEQINNSTDAETPLKVKAAIATCLFKEMAEKRGISLKLRKKQL